MNAEAMIRNQLLKAASEDTATLHENLLFIIEQIIAFLST